jgi:hypothetical protein
MQGIFIFLRDSFLENLQEENSSILNCSSQAKVACSLLNS